jgi:hypothetical protein
MNAPWRKVARVCLVLRLQTVQGPLPSQVEISPR